jgi:L-seryl-tRNA(Ser) seleniumtransferase
MIDDRNEILKNLPKIDRLLEDDSVRLLMDRFPRAMVVELVRNHLDALRMEIVRSAKPSRPLDFSNIVGELVSQAENALGRSMTGAVNGTGIVLHTGLGRAPFAGRAQTALAEVVRGYCTLQVDRETGKRGDRHAHVEGLLKKITGAEAALVVNNNAAATLLVLNTLAEGRDVIVSRGELVEIGGSFRIPDVLTRSGAVMVEVGTTNRTHLKDYEQAVTPGTSMLLKVHQSNYRIIGFTKQVGIDALAELAHAKGILAVDDLGSGALVDLSRWGLPREPMVQESVRAGVDAVCFSGDKLIGGPQCGIVVGKKECVDRMKKNALMRALRVDKMTYAVLEATLRLFLDGDKGIQSHPVLSMLIEPAESVRKRCLILKRKLNTVAGTRFHLDVVKEYSETGSGSLAAEPMPTYALSIRMDGVSSEELARQFRLSSPPVFGRVKSDRFLIDCRTVRRDEFIFLERAVRKMVR